ncbi:MAG: tyrosine-type recombinase/integrase [Faecalibacterium sp.]|nr:tyrosine-type recombinase/integrase [Ruminococcus sp.]MCM1391767.1 tyrosine-type recombinase/integrase [Ruminococcus sp.]MCM1485047.1 tyrosine-type recombinase/integrase [Faecalibacterium sp.]
MLMNCPECELQVSDKAILCPHCGYPIKPNSATKIARGSNKRKRLPNGFGQISEIKNKRLRNPFRAMVTVGKTPEGKPICKPLKPQSYFPTYNDAYAALVEYNRNPYDLNPTITVHELYEKWSEEYFKTIKSKNRIVSVRSAWKYCFSIYDMPISEIRARHMKGCINDGTIIVKGEVRHPSANTKYEIKEIFNMLFDYALEYDLVDKNYSRLFKLPADVIKEKTTVKKDHIIYSDDEMNKLWSNIDAHPFTDIILVQCYSGWRPQEICSLKLEDVDLTNWTFKGGMKTESGTNRVVPIHTKIRDIVFKKYQEAVSMNSKYLFNSYDVKNRSQSYRLTYYKFKYRFDSVITDLHLNPEHRPHDGRKHFVTLAKKYEVDEYAIKYIVGHAITDITEKVYTQRDIEWLRSEMEKIK